MPASEDHSKHSLDELLDGMASPDPTVRDGWAYAQLAELVESRTLTSEQVAAVRARMVANLASPAVQARCFAPLVLTWLVAAGHGEADSVRRAVSWWTAEEDTRGYDGQLGWLHAVAHGADLVGEAVTAGLLSPTTTLTAIGQRLVGPGGPWVHQEQGRVAVAVLAALRSPRCTAADAIAWRGPVDEVLDACEALPALDGAPPAWVHNLVTTLATVQLGLSRTTVPAERPLREAMEESIGEVVARVQPWLLG